MPTGVITVSQYVANPPQQVDAASTLEVRGWYSRDYISVDGVTPIFGNSTNGEQGPYYSTTPSLNPSGEIVVPAHDVQITVGANPTANYFEGLWIDGAFTMLLLPNTNGATGWQIPSVYGDPIAYDEIATYNRARRLVYAPDTYFTADQVIQEIERLAGNQQYMAVGVNGIGQASFPPVVASAPIVLMENDPRVGSWYNILSASAATSNTAAQNAVAIAAAVTAASISGGGIYIPVGTFITNSVTINVPIMFAPGASILSPANGQTITITKAVTADSSKHFSGQGTISFANAAPFPVVNVLWWGTNTTPGTTDMTTTIQAAITATGGRGAVYIPQSDYKVTSSLTIPTYSGSDPSQAPLLIYGDGPYTSNLINQAGASNPTLIINQDFVQVRGIGVWGKNGFPNDGIKITGAGKAGGVGRIYIENTLVFAYGHGFFMEKTQSIWIQNCFGSSAAGLVPPSAGGFSYSGSEAFVHIDLPSGGFANHVVIQNNMCEDYRYKVYADGSGGGAGNDITIEGNQFEGGPNGIYLNSVFHFRIEDNYLGEGQTGYPIELIDCRFGRVKNYMHFDGVTYTAKNSTIKLTNAQFSEFAGYIPTVWMAGTSNGLNFTGSLIGRLIDETSDQLYGLFNVGSSIGVPKFTFQMEVGRSTWHSDSTSIMAYPGARLSDEIKKATPAGAASPGWVCTTAAATGSLVHTVGTGPSPTILPDYYQPTAYDFRITITTGGAVGTSVYKVEYKTQGGGSYADLVTNLTTTEVPRMIMGVALPDGVFTMKWPAGNYVLNDVFTLTSVVAPVWKTVAALGA